MTNAAHDQERSAMSDAWDAYDATRDASWDAYRAQGYTSLQSRDLARRDHRELYEKFLQARQDAINAKKAQGTS